MSEYVPDFRSVARSAGDFPPQAVQFIQDGLSHTARVLHGEPGENRDDPALEEEGRHVTGQQLCLGLRDFAIRQYGRLARTVLRSWNIRSTDDFGKIVFAMIEAGYMRKTDDDSIEHFRGVFDFEEAFGDLSVTR